MTCQDWGGGVVAVTNDGVGADGSPTGNRIVFRYDGRDYPMAARDQTDYATIAFVVTSVNPWVADYTIKVNGNVVGTATESISRNGRTMTVETRGPDPDGLVMQTGYWEKH